MEGVAGLPHEEKAGPSQQKSTNDNLGDGKDCQNTENFFTNSKRLRGMVKHNILRRALESYIPIMAQQKGFKDPAAARFPKVVVVDGFAGKGTYDIGEEGSPMLAYRTAMKHVLQPNFAAGVHFVFIEAEKDFATELEITYKVVFGEFEEKIDSILAEFRGMPFFVFLDPFGCVGMEMEVVRKLCDRPHTDVLLNICYPVRWIYTKNYDKILAGWFGREDWRKHLPQNLGSPKERMDRFMQFYIAQLMETKKKSVLKFNMKDGSNRVIYNLIFTSKHIKGIEGMKRSMLKVTQDYSEFGFSEHLADYPSKIPAELSDEEILSDTVTRILTRFGGESSVYGDDIEAFIWCDTPYIFNFKPKLKTILFQKYLNNGETKRLLTGHNSPSGSNSNGSNSSPNNLQRTDESVSSLAGSSTPTKNPLGFPVISGTISPKRPGESTPQGATPSKRKRNTPSSKSPLTEGINANTAFNKLVFSFPKCIAESDNGDNGHVRKLFKTDTLEKPSS